MDRIKVKITVQFNRGKGTEFFDKEDFELPFVPYPGLVIHLPVSNTTVIAIVGSVHFDPRAVYLDENKDEQFREEISVNMMRDFEQGIWDLDEEEHWERFEEDPEWFGY